MSNKARDAMREDKASGGNTPPKSTTPPKSAPPPTKSEGIAGQPKSPTPAPPPTRSEGIAGQPTFTPAPTPPATGGGGGGGGGGGAPTRPSTPAPTPPPTLPPPPSGPSDLEKYLAEQNRLAKMQQDAQKAAQRQSVYDLLRELANAYDIGEGIADRIIDLLVDKGYTNTAARLALQNTPEYKERFQGIELYNKNFAADIASGRKAAAPTPADYIQAEKDYQEVLTRYGLGNLATRGTYATLIGGDVSAAEVTDRIINVYDKIRNADEVLKTQLKSFFPSYNESDFAEVLLTESTPEGMANRLKNKLAAAEISSEASRAGLGIDAARALELQAMGVSRTLARAGYSQIATQQQRLGMLGSIYETDVTDLQTELEAEQFQGLASQRRKRLTSQEGATFSGRAGTSQVSLGQSAAGAI